MKKIALFVILLNTVSTFGMYSSSQNLLNIKDSTISNVSQSDAPDSVRGTTETDPGTGEGRWG